MLPPLTQTRSRSHTKRFPTPKKTPHIRYICCIATRRFHVQPEDSGVPRGGVWGVQTPPPPEIPKTL